MKSSRRKFWAALASLVGAWDSDAQSCRVSIPKGDADPNSRLFCRACRELLAQNDSRGYVILDLSDPAHPLVYPLEAGAVYHVLDQTLLVEDGGEEYTLTTLPADIPPELSPWREVT